MNIIGKTLIIFGAALIVLGIVLQFTGKVPEGGKIPWLGKLPGDMYIQKKNFSFYFPLTTCILASLILSFIFWIFSRK